VDVVIYMDQGDHLKIRPPNGSCEVHTPRSVVYLVRRCARSTVGGGYPFCLLSLREVRSTKYVPRYLSQFAGVDYYAVPTMYADPSDNKGILSSCKIGLFLICLYILSFSLSLLFVFLFFFFFSSYFKIVVAS
jgi:hypothetical protein